MSTNRAPSTVWSVGMLPTMRAYVRTTDDDNILIAADSVSVGWTGLNVDRRTARMIARRINQCLDKTAKR